MSSHKLKEELNWLQELVEFYDFIWQQGTEICGHHINDILVEDFRNGGLAYQQMIEKIVEKYPTLANALSAFRDRGASISRLSGEGESEK